MNLYFSLLYDQASIDLAKGLINRYQPEICYFSYQQGNFIKSVPASAFNEYISTQMYFCSLDESLILTDYSGCAFYEDCPPVDSSLLSTMAEDEPIILKMIDRLPSVKDKTYDDRLRIYHRHLRYWSHVLDATNIGIAVFTGIPHLIYDYIIYCLCKKKSIAVAFRSRTIGLYAYTYFAYDIKTQGAEVLSLYKNMTEYYKDTPIEKIELPADYQDVFEILCGNQSNKTPAYVVSEAQRMSASVAITNRIKKYVNNLRANKISYLKTSLSAHLRGYRTRKNFLDEYDRLSVPADFTKPYIYLPLHYQPEEATSPLGGVFVHQQLIAQMISYYLPEDILIYVKEHPLQIYNIGGRETSLYHDLGALPNVRLVSRSTDTYALLEHCIAVAACTGTAGLEGMFMGKPFLMFGYHINMYAPGTFAIRNNEDCQMALEYILKHGAKHTLKDMKIYFKALSELSVNHIPFRRYAYGEVPAEGFDSKIMEEGLARVIDSQLIL